LEEHSRRLVNSAKNGLTVLGKSINQIKDRPGSLTVKTRGGFVEEKEQLGLGGKFNTDGKALSLFNVQTWAKSVNCTRFMKTKPELTFTRNTNDGISVSLHTKQLDDLFNIIKLLLTGNMGGLTKQSTEAQSLTDGGCVKVKILLLHVTSLALKRLIARAAIDQHFTADNTHSHTSSKYV
jgi:hypothetical protein